MFKPNGAPFVKAARHSQAAAIDNIVKAYAAGFPQAALKIFMSIRTSISTDDLVRCYRAAFTYGDDMAGRTLFMADFHTHYTVGGARHIAVLTMAAAEYPDFIETVIKYGSQSRCDSDNMCAVMSAAISDDMKKAFIEAYKDRYPPKNYLFYMAQHTPSQLRRMLDLLDPDQASPDLLARVAVTLLSSSQAAPEGIQAAFEMLLARGMNIHHDEGNVMYAALHKGYIDMADKLLAAGFEVGLHADAIYEKLCNTGAPRESIDYIKRQGVKGLPPADAAGYQRIDADSIALQQRLPDDIVLTTVFNFNTHQQILITQAGAQISAPTVVPFSQIENRAAVAAAAAAFVDAGGDQDKVANTAPVKIAKSKER